MDFENRTATENKNNDCESEKNFDNRPVFNEVMARILHTGASIP